MAIPFFPKRIKLLSFDEFNVPGLVLEVDVAKSEQHGRTVEVAKHPVGTGIPVTDNVRARPEEFSCLAIWTDRPASIADTVKKVIRWQFVSDIYDQLIGVQEKGHTFTIETTLRTYNNMLLESISTPRSSEVGNHIECAMKFVQQRKASSVVIAIPARTGLSKKVTQGTKPTTAVSQTTKAPSMAKRIVNTLTNIFSGKVGR